MRKLETKADGTPLTPLVWTCRRCRKPLSERIEDRFTRWSDLTDPNRRHVWTIARITKQNKPRTSRSTHEASYHLKCIPPELFHRLRQLVESAG